MSYKTMDGMVACGEEGKKQRSCGIRYSVTF